MQCDTKMRMFNTVIIDIINDKTPKELHLVNLLIK